MRYSYNADNAGNEPPTHRIERKKNYGCDRRSIWFLCPKVFENKQQTWGT
jgi:hypothetical protein